MQMIGPSLNAQVLRQEPLAEQAYRVLQEWIATGELEPGQRLTERAIAAQLNVSPTPVREAFRRLEQDGLVQRSGPRALTVVQHSDETLRELLYAEVVLRAATARFAASKISDRQIDELSRIVDEIRRRERFGSADEILELARRFDELVATAADSPAVQRLAQGAGFIGDRRRLQAIDSMLGPSRTIGRRHYQAHRDIVSAFRDRDPDAAERVVREHLLSSVALLLATGCSET